MAGVLFDELLMSAASFVLILLSIREITVLTSLRDLNAALELMSYAPTATYAQEMLIAD